MAVLWPVMACLLEILANVLNGLQTGQLFDLTYTSLEKLCEIGYLAFIFRVTRKSLMMDKQKWIS